MVRSEFPQARLIANTDNLGFSQGQQPGHRRVPKPLCRSCSIPTPPIHPGALDALVAFADAHPQAGILGPKVLNPDGSLQFSCRRFPNLGAGFFRNTYLGRLFPQQPLRPQLSDGGHRTTTSRAPWTGSPAAPC